MVTSPIPLPSALSLLSRSRASELSRADPVQIAAIFFEQCAADVEQLGSGFEVIADIASPIQNHRQRVPSSINDLPRIDESLIFKFSVCADGDSL